MRKNVVRRSLVGLLTAGGLILAVAGPSAAQASAQHASSVTTQVKQIPASPAADWQWYGDYDSQWECEAIGGTAVIWWGYSQYSCNYFDGSGKWQLYVA
ncbi:hypothetical protein [Streptomyces griseoaurantiacus]|uniref:hypothetical protein n=1 Tax=Streptomyces TaxID=1883 RepID=UPI000593B5E6|nr:hypothetical protein [Streptomyces griseoaurantiacus]